MQSLSRRQWLKTAGMAGAFSLTGGAFAQETAPAAALQEGPIRLNSNENPFGPSPRVLKAIEEGFRHLCRYPYPYMRSLTEALARKHGVSPDHIVLTSGSGEGLKACGLAFGLHGGEIIAAQPTFLALMEYAQQFGAYVHYVPLDAERNHDLEAMERRMTGQTRLVFVCNPNNPTGTLLRPDRLRSFCRAAAARSVVLVDEAYHDYIGEADYPSMTELVLQGLNVVVSRTFSKVYGMAGLRMGYLMARPDLAQRLRSHAMATPSVPALLAATAALEDTEFYRMSLSKNAESQEMMYRTLDGLRYPYLRSHANFVFFDSGRDVQEMIGAMQARGILIGRPFPPMHTWCRVSTGRIADTEAFCKALRELA
ncbi:MAG: histidinol-phosphate transaminase [Bacteroidia bacterium]|nr:histidinol-phosphate transaminase [Bacteroidia bacterium]